VIVTAAIAACGLVFNAAYVNLTIAAIITISSTAPVSQIIFRNRVHSRQGIRRANEYGCDQYKHS